MSEADKDFMRRAIELAQRGMGSNAGGPFGCVIVKEGRIVGEGWNRVTSDNDPTAHAEVVAIRDACTRLSSFQLTGCKVYTSCEPCPMCLGALYWARPEAIFFAANRDDAAYGGFDDDFIYKELERPIGERTIPLANLLPDEGRALFDEWLKKTDKTTY
ncbi:MAG: Guanine deaminase [Acidobacteria bacterium OLB17]|nr:MAG: Guanine deaminase [Acidobacteria bacterium OLB17]MCZ2390065.1 nucleoside deaminase [Acidobacteriota bacterium]